MCLVFSLLRGGGLASFLLFFVVFKKLAQNIKYASFLGRSSATVADLICATNEASKVRSGSDFERIVWWGTRLNGTVSMQKKTAEIANRKVKKKTQHLQCLDFLNFILTVSRLHHSRQNSRKTSASSHHKDHHQSPRIVHSGRKTVNSGIFGINSSYKSQKKNNIHKHIPS